jgi:2-keto-4-pentenoate hydratase/2-oxohepta-3-ene-1,7-dioic acid hydratase in catechol pathway
MRLSSYQYQGEFGYGLVADDGIIDLKKRLGDRYPTLLSALKAEALDEIRQLTTGLPADFATNTVVFLPPIPEGNIVHCIGLNYKDHIAETGRKAPEFPHTFTKFSRTFVGHDQPMVRPKASDKYDYEGELAFVIGKRGRHVPENTALDYVAGYTCFNDGSIRDWQHGRDINQGKNFHRSSAIGPWITTADEIPDPSRLTLATRLNGERVQHSGIDQLLFTIPHLVSYISTFTVIEPGDIVATGTPSGVGSRREPPLFLKPGDAVEVEISGIGALCNSVVDE